MNIVVIGMGEVGRYVTGVLVQEGHNIIVVDNHAESLARAEEAFDVMTILGHGASGKVLRELNLETCDLFVAVTDNSEINLISALRARQFGASRTIARANETVYFDDDDRGLVTDLLGIDLVINPRALVALEINRLIRSVSALSVEDFADNRIDELKIEYGRAQKELQKLRGME